MGTFKNFEEMPVWKSARELANKIYLLMNEEPFSRDYKLKDQINGSSGSIMDNIAEGYERDGSREFLHFLSIAKGSAGEVRSQLYRVRDRSYINEDEFEVLKSEVMEISKQLSGLMSYIRKSDIKGTKFIREPESDYRDESQFEI